MSALVDTHFFFLEPFEGTEWKRSKWVIVLPSSLFFLKGNYKIRVGWLYRKWHTECPGTPPARLHSGGIRPGPLAGQPASTGQRLSTDLTSNYSLTFPASFLFSSNPTKRKITPLIKCSTYQIKKAQFKSLTCRKKRHKSSAVYCFPLHSSSTGLKVSTELSWTGLTGRWPSSSSDFSSSSWGRWPPDSVIARTHTP